MSVSWYTTLVQSEMAQQLLDALLIIDIDGP